MSGIVILRKIFFALILALLCNTLFHSSAAAVPEVSDFCCESYPLLYLSYPYQKSSEVSELQQALTNLGYYHDSLSGIYDEKTKLAVQTFQQTIGLASDGIVKYHVWLKLAKETEKLLADDGKKPPPPGKVHLVIDTFRRKLLVFSDEEVYAQFPIAIGKSDSPSPLGNWKVISKARKDNSMLGTRWMGLNVPWGVYGIHGTNKPWTIGSMASHGCFRMWNKDVEIIYPWVKVSTQVTVIGSPFGYMSGGLQKMQPGDSSSGVISLQGKLSRLGFYNLKVDGRFGPGTTKAVKELQRCYTLTETGFVDIAEYKIMGISK